MDRTIKSQANFLICAKSDELVIFPAKFLI